MTTLFFSIGAYLGSRKKSLFSLDNFGVIIVSLYLIIAIIDALTINQVFNPYLHKISIMLGISSALFSTKLIAKNETLKSLIIKLSGVSFFVYAAHEPLLTILKKILYRILSLDSSFDSSFTTLLLYFFILIITIICTIVAYVALTRVAPKFVSIITGGR